MALILRNVTKKYREFTAVEALDMRIETGEIFGLIGQNGAGKTTTFRMILHLQEATSGEILWDGQPLHTLPREMLGYLPEERGIFPQMKVEEQLLFFGILRGMKKAQVKQEVAYWLQRFELEEKRNVKAETLSKGNQQKVQLIASFIHRPQFLILDEPFSGLDPVNKELLKRAIVELKENGTTILFSSHQMENVEELCDRLCLLKQGKSLFAGSLLDLKKQYGKTNLVIRTNISSETFLGMEGVRSARRVHDEIHLRLADERFAEAIFSLVSRAGFVDKFSLDYLSLDDIFKRKVGAVDV